MDNKDDRLKWFEANLNDKHPGVSLDDLSQSFRLNPDNLRCKIANGQEFDSMVGSVIKGFLGCSLNEFVEGGRAICAEGSQPAPLKNDGGDFQGLLNEARDILKAGGDKAQALTTIIRLMKK